MKKLFLVSVIMLLTGLTNLSAQDFYLAPNGVTCMCTNANVGDSGVVNGITYTKRTKEQITDANASTTCTSGITDMAELFIFHTDFNGDISSWDMSEVISAYSMFTHAESFNHDLSNWDMSNVIEIDYMFESTLSFDQDLSNWEFNQNTFYGHFVMVSGLSVVNYDLLLNAFNDQNITDNGLIANGLVYCDSVVRENLITNKGWVINGDTHLQTFMMAPNELNISTDVGSCVATNVNLDTPSITTCSITSLTNNAPTEFPIGETLVNWTLIDGDGLEFTDTQVVNVTLPVDVAEICYVSSDDNDVTNNRIFLYNFDGLNVTTYEVSRETNVGGVYESIGFIIPPETSLLDNTSNNTSQAYRYIVSTADVCGSTSPDSDYHKTILLQASIAADNSVNLSWSPYVGADYNTYNIFKQVNGGDYVLLTSLSSSNTSYNDVDVDVTVNSYKYYISIDIDTCVNDGNPLVPSALKSNLGNINPDLSVITPEEIGKSIILYPNPATTVVTVSIPDNVMLKEIRIINSLGQLISKHNTPTINVQNLNKGIYYLRIETDKGSFSKKLEI